MVAGADGVAAAAGQPRAEQVPCRVWIAGSRGRGADIPAPRASRCNACTSRLDEAPNGGGEAWHANCSGFGMPRGAPLVRHYMTPNPVFVAGSTSLQDALDRMREIRARHMPVYIGGRLVGLLSDRDVERFTAAGNVDLRTITAEQACSPKPFVCTSDAPLAQVVQELIENKLSAALVIDEGELVGLFTVIDGMRALVALVGLGQIESA